MNFDANTLSALMQMLGTPKTPNTDTYGGSNDADRAKSSYNDGHGGYEQNRSYTNERGRSGYTAQSVFAMQNGLGEQIDIDGKTREESKRKSASQTSANTNPMASLLSMMSGGSGTGGTNGDMMSAFMPMFLNMMNGKQNVAAASQKPQPSADKSAEHNPQSDTSDEDLKKYKKMFDEMLKKEQESLKNEKEPCSTTDSDAENSDGIPKQNKRQNEKAYEKTQPSRADMFAPIAFAGYTLISALNRLYSAKRAL